MATPIRTALTFLRLSTAKTKSLSVVNCQKWLPTVSQVRHSRYDTSYLEPTFTKSELAEPLSDNDPRKFQPIKAATPEQTSSLTYDPVVAKFIRMMIRRGEKDSARICIDRTFEEIKLTQLRRYHRETDDEVRAAIVLDPLTIFHKAVENCEPLLVTQRTKRGGITYTVPVPCEPSYKRYKAMRWLIDSCRLKEKELRFWDHLAAELIAASQNQGKSIRKKQELHKICEANRAYAHYRW